MGREKIWSITYADDIVLLADREEELKSMMKRFRRFLEKKKMTMSTEKSKIIVFEKSRGRAKKREWKHDGKEIEEVKEMKYWGYLMQKSGAADRHIRERKAKAIMAMKSAWSIGEKISKDSYERRIKMFGALAESERLYGAKVWGWKEDEGLNGIKRKYIKWILGLDTTTPKYMISEECKIKDTGMKALERAIRYEVKARESERILVK